MITPRCLCLCDLCHVCCICLPRFGQRNESLPPLTASATMSHSHYRDSTNITHSLVPNTAQILSNELNVADTLLHRLTIIDHCDPQETLLEHCLQAILSHSTVEEQCAVLLSAPTLPLFSRCREASCILLILPSLYSFFSKMACNAPPGRIIAAHPDNARIKSLIGKIISNFSLHQPMHQVRPQTNLVSIVEQHTC